MSRRIWAMLAVASFLAPAARGAGADVAALIQDYLRFALSGQVAAQARQLAPDNAEVQAFAGTWQAARKTDVRESLTARFGADGRGRFESFVAEFTAAEGRQDRSALADYAQQLGLDPPPATFVELRAAVLHRDLASDLNEGAALLARLQTWIEAHARGDAIPLAGWMAAGPEPGVAASSAANPLRDAEGGGESAWSGSEEEANPMDSFDAGRKARREQALQDAQAGMDQVAAERQAAEQEYADKKMAAAQADADNVRRQAERLAASEQEALEQRQKSWGNRLKSIVGSTLTAATGAFTGGIGTRAGQEAAAALFDD